MNVVLQPGQWRGRGSYRPIDESLGIAFRAQIEINDDRQGLLINATLDVDGGATPSILVWIVADEFGTYTITVRGLGVDVQGTAKLESEPCLGLLWSDDGATHVAFALFALHDTHGLRGFARIGTVTWTWELALHPRHSAGGLATDAKDAANVVSLAAWKDR